MAAPARAMSQNRPMTKFRVLAPAAVIAGLAVAACGGSSSTATSSSSAVSSSSTSAAPSAGNGTNVLSLAAAPSGQLKFDKSSLAAKAGKVTIAFTNRAPEGHNLTIQQGTNGKVIAATPTFSGATRTLVVDLKPGTYTFFCSVPGHRMGGMQGTLKVR